MALKKTISVIGRNILSTEFGAIDTGEITVEIHAYIKVENCGGSKDQASCLVSFSSEEKKFSRTYVFQPSMSGENFIAQAYEHLKTLPEFEGAVDC